MNEKVQSYKNSEPMSLKDFYSMLNKIKNLLIKGEFIKDRDQKKINETLYLKDYRYIINNFYDKDYNLRRWLMGEKCIFTSPVTGELMEIEIGSDYEAIYNFLIYCKKLNTHEKISSDFTDYLTLVISRSQYSDEEWEEC